jgi:hypothetical protein
MNIRSPVIDQFRAAILGMLLAEAHYTKITLAKSLDHWLDCVEKHTAATQDSALMAEMPPASLDHVLGWVPSLICQYDNPALRSHWVKTSLQPIELQGIAYLMGDCVELLLAQEPLWLMHQRFNDQKPLQQSATGQAVGNAIQSFLRIPESYVLAVGNTWYGSQNIRAAQLTGLLSGAYGGLAHLPTVWIEPFYHQEPDAFAAIWNLSNGLWLQWAGIEVSSKADKTSVQPLLSVPVECL